MSYPATDAFYRVHVIRDGAPLSWDQDASIAGRDRQREECRSILAECPSATHVEILRWSQFGAEVVETVARPAGRE